MTTRIIRALALAGALAALVACSSNGSKNNAATQAPAAASATKAATVAAGSPAPATSATPAGGVSSPATPVPASATSSASAQKVKTGGTLTLGIVADVINLDSAKTQDVYSSYVESQVAEPLFIAGQDLKIT